MGKQVTLTSDPSTDLRAGDEAADRRLGERPLALRSSTKLAGARIVSGEALA